MKHRLLKLGFLTALLACVGYAHGQATHVQGCGYQATGSTSSVSCTLPNPVAAGDFLWMCVSNTNAATPAWSGDSGTITADPNFTNVRFNTAFSASCAYIETAAGGGSVITATASGLSYASIVVDEYSAVGAFDLSDSGATGTGTSPASNSITTTHSNDLVLGFVSSSSNASVTAGSGYTLAAQGIGAGSFGANEYQNLASAGAIAATATLNLSANWVSHVAAFATVANVAATPVIAPVSGRLSAQTPVVIGCATAGHVIHYTTDGSDPTSGTLYTGPFNSVASGAETVKAVCGASGYTNSAIATANYTVHRNIYFVRSDGGTRYSPNMTAGQCDGLADVAYPGSGTNQHCAFNSVRYLWDDFSALVGIGQWVNVGGDWIVLRGCHALDSEVNASDPDCRIGWNNPNNGNSPNSWCYGVGAQGCMNPPIPAGTASNPTKIMGGCAYDNTPCTPIDNHYPYGATNETQLFCGFALNFCLNLAATQNVSISGIELTTHNAAHCVYHGYPRAVGCSTNSPFSDFAQNGILTDNATAGLSMTDVYVHGFAAAGISGPIGGVITATRVSLDFNGYIGWNFADIPDTPNAAGSQILASYVTMIGNGFDEEYPIVHTQFPAFAGYDDLSQGFGDAWSGQDSPLDTFTCDHCVMKYNTKDGFIGPHTQIKHLRITNSAWQGNMGQSVKFGTDTNADVVFENNVVMGNSYRMCSSAALPGAAHSFAESTGLDGAYLSDCGRAGGDIFSIIEQAGSTLTFANNTVLGSSQTLVDTNCGYVNHAGGTLNGGLCGSVPNNWTNNIFAGWINPDCSACGGLATGMWYKADSTISYTSNYNLEYGVRNGDTGGTNLYVSPLLLNQPSQTWPGEAAFDIYDVLAAGNGFYPASGSPVIGAGIAVSGLTTDIFGTTRSSPPWLGAVNSQYAMATSHGSYGRNIFMRGAVAH